MMPFACGKVMPSGNLQLARISAKHNLDDALTSEEHSYYMLDVATIASILVWTWRQCCTTRRWHQILPTRLKSMSDMRIDPICVDFAEET